jgi:hypothetical protein
VCVYVCVFAFTFQQFSFVAGSPTVYSNFADGALCPAFVDGRKVCLATGADCSNAKKWDASKLVRACSF